MILIITFLKTKHEKIHYTICFQIKFKIKINKCWSKELNLKFTVDVRGPEAAQPDVPVVRPADDDAAAHQEAVVAQSRHEGYFKQTIISMETINPSRRFYVPARLVVVINVLIWGVDNATLYMR